MGLLGLLNRQGEREARALLVRWVALVPATPGAMVHWLAAAAAVGLPRGTWAATALSA